MVNNGTTIENELFKLDPAADEAMLVKKFEKDTDKTLFPAQSERIMISIIAYMANVVLARIQNALKLFFIQHTTIFFLRLWGEFVDCPQLGAKQAHDILEVILYEPYSTEKTLPKGSKIQTKDGEYNFLTDEDLIIPAGETKGYVAITSELAGTVLNNYAAGEINTLIENYGYIKSVSNLNGATGGEDIEDVERYRQRLLSAPEKFSTAGPTGAYEYFAMSAHQGILDAKATSSAPGVVDIYILINDQLNENTALSALYNSVSKDERRPLTDNVKGHIAEKIEVNYNATATLKLDADWDTTVIQIENVLNKYFDTLRQKLNTEIVPSDAIALVKEVKGVYDFVPGDLVIKPGYINKYYDCKINNLVFKRQRDNVNA